MKNFALIFFLFTVFSVKSNTLYSVNSGSWDDPLIWDLGIIPEIGDSIVIGKSHTVKISKSLHQSSLELFGILELTKDDIEFNCDSLTTFSNSRLIGTESSTFKFNNINVIGSTNFGASNIIISNQLKIQSTLSFNSSKGKLIAKNLLIDNVGIWNNFKMKECSINNIINKGKFLSGKGKYKLGGDIITNQLITIESLELIDSLSNFDSLQINTELKPNNFYIVNKSNAVLIVNTTKGNFNNGILKTKAKDNQLILGRESFQYIPKSIDNHYEVLNFQNYGTVNWLDTTSIKVSKLIIGKDTKLTFDLNRILFIENTIINCYGLLSFNNKHSKDLVTLYKNIKSLNFYDFSTFSINIKDSVYLPFEFKANNVNFTSNDKSFVLGDSINLKVNNLYIDNNVTWITRESNINITGNWNGTGIILDSLLKVKFLNSKLVTLPNINFNKLSFLNCDSIFLNNIISVGKMEIMNSNFISNSIILNSLEIDSLSSVSFKGTNNNIDSVNNFGKIDFTAFNGDNIIGFIKNNTSAVINVFNGGDFTILKDIYNNGTINGCDRTDCYWTFLNSITIKGDGDVFTPRVIGEGITIRNLNNWTISSEFSGNSIITNEKSLLIECNASQFEANVIGLNKSEIKFQKEGDQSVDPQKIAGNNKVIFSKTGRKSLINNFDIDGSLEVEHGCVLDLNTIKVFQKSDGHFHLKDSSQLIIGKTNSYTNWGFPSGFIDDSVSLSVNSNVIYQSKGNQVIKGGFLYGNLELNNGAVDSAFFTFDSDSLKIMGVLNQRKSSQYLKLNNQYLIINSDWEGPGNLMIINSKVDFYGDGYNYGELITKNSKFYYKGSKNQRMKIGAYEDLIIAKDSEAYVSTRGNQGTLNVEKMIVESGKLLLSTEEITISDSLINYSQIEITNKIQNKVINNIYNHKEAKFSCSIPEELTIIGDVTNKGEILFEDGIVFFSGNSNQKISNYGKEIVFSKVNILVDSLNMIGRYRLTDTLDFNKDLLFNSAEVYFDSDAYLMKSNYRGTKKTKLVGEVIVDSGMVTDVFGIGVKLAAKSDMGKVYIEQNYDVQEGLDGVFPYQYIIKPEFNEDLNTDITMNFPYDINEIEEYKIIKSIDEGMYYFELPTIIHDDKLTVKNVSEFSWWSGAKSGTDVLTVDLIYFDVSKNEIKWEVGYMNNVSRFIIEFVSFDNDTSYVSMPVNNSKDTEFIISRFNEIGYYQLYEVTLNQDTIAIPKGWFILREYGDDNSLSSIDIINNQIVCSPNTVYSDIYIFDLSGRMINRCSNCNQLNLSEDYRGAFIVKAFSYNTNITKKFLIH